MRDATDFYASQQNSSTRVAYYAIRGFDARTIFIYFWVIKTGRANKTLEPIGTAPCSSTAVGDSDVVVAVIAWFPVPMAQLFR